MRHVATPASDEREEAGQNCKANVRRAASVGANVVVAVGESSTALNWPVYESRSSSTLNEDRLARRRAGSNCAEAGVMNDG